MILLKEISVFNAAKQIIAKNALVILLIALLVILDFIFWMEINVSRSADPTNLKIILPNNAINAIQGVKNALQLTLLLVLRANHPSF